MQTVAGTGGNTALVGTKSQQGSQPVLTICLIADAGTAGADLEAGASDVAASAMTAVGAVDINACAIVVAIIITCVGRNTAQAGTKRCSRAASQCSPFASSQMQVPLEQTWCSVVLHTVPHVPQLSMSIEVLVHVLLQQVAVPVQVLMDCEEVGWSQASGRKQN